MSQQIFSIRDLDKSDHSYFRLLLLPSFNSLWSLKLFPKTTLMFSSILHRG